MAKSIYLFTGNEELMIRNKIETLIASVKAPSFNKTTYDLENTSLSDAINDCMTIPLIGDSKVVVLRNPKFLEKGKHEDIKNGIKMFLEYCAKPNEDCLLIIDASSITIDEKSDCYHALEKAAEISNTKNLSDVEMKGWLRSFFIRNKKTITDSAIDLFFDYVGTNLVKGKQEVDKLLNYIGDKQIVDEEVIRNVVSDDGETDIYALTQAINSKDKAMVHKKYTELIKNGYDQISLLAIIYRMFKDLYTVIVLLEKGNKQNDIANIMGISPGRAYYIMKDVSKYNKETIQKILINITDLDYKIKTGQIDNATGMDLFLFGL